MSASFPSPVDVVLSRLEGVKPTGTDKWIAKCPAHEDKKQSLSVGLGNNGGVLLNCFAGCELDSILNAVRLKASDLYPDQPLAPAPATGAVTGRKRICGTYDYTDSAGALLFQVVRYHPKGFSQRCPDPAKPGDWIFNLNGVDRVLYRLPEVIAAIAAKKPIYLVEGEKDADTVQRFGLTATTNSGGAAKWLQSYSESLARAHVVIIPDNDDAGRKHAQRAGADLIGSAASVRVLELPNLPPKGDVSDWLQSGGSREELWRLSKAAPTWELWSASAAPDVPAPAAAPKFQLTDDGNALRLIDRHGKDIRFSYAQSRWYVWDDVRWKRDDGDAIEMRAKRTARELLRSAAEIVDMTEQKTIASHALKMQSHPRLQAMIALARSEVPISIDHFDRERWYLNCANGTIDLRTGQRKAHDRADLITKLAPVAFNPEAQAPRWDRFLEEVLPDTDTRAFLQRAAGYALTGDVSEQCLFFLYGSGSNGKSTFLGTLLEVLGDYALQAAPDLLIAKESNGGPNNDVADLLGARFVATVEVEDGKRMAEGLVKQITGADKIKARFMRQDYFTFDPTHKIFLAANHQPVVKGQDFAIWRRIKVIPFTVQIADEAKDIQLPDKLRAEFPGILAWAVRGCQEWQKTGLGEPEAVKAATAEYRDDMDVLRDFLDDCCVLRPSLTVSSGAIYKVYTEWCEQSGTRPLGKISFGVRLKEESGVKPCDRVPQTRGRGWAGIGLRSDRDSENPGVLAQVAQVEGIFPIDSLISNSPEDNPENTCDLCHLCQNTDDPDFSTDDLTDPFADEEDTLDAGF